MTPGEVLGKNCLGLYNVRPYAVEKSLLNIAMTILVNINAHFCHSSLFSSCIFTTLSKRALAPWPLWTF